MKITDILQVAVGGLLCAFAVWAMLAMPGLLTDSASLVSDITTQIAAR